MIKKLILPIALIIFSCSAEDSCEPTPKLTTAEAEDISDVYATISGTIKPPTCDDTVTSQGFVYGEENLPTVEDTKIIRSGSSISAPLINLKQNTTYYVRTFFENPTGVYYGNEVIFNTDVGDVVIKINAIRNLTSTSASVDVQITSSGGGDISDKGLCYSTESLPTINDSSVISTTNSNAFSVELSDLKNDTSYFARAYATNINGLFYSDEVLFNTSDVFEETGYRKNGNTYTIDLTHSNFSTLANTGGWMNGGSIGIPVLILRLSQSEYQVFTNICPNDGANNQWQLLLNLNPLEFKCNTHNGSYLTNCAPSELPCYNSSFSSDILTFTIN